MTKLNSTFIEITGKVKDELMKHMNICMDDGLVYCLCAEDPLAMISLTF